VGQVRPIAGGTPGAVGVPTKNPEEIDLGSARVAARLRFAGGRARPVVLAAASMESEAVMWTQTVQAWGVGALMITCTSAARAECGTEADCKAEPEGERREAKAAPRAVSDWDSAATQRAEYEAAPTTRSHSVPMLITGIALVVAAPVLFIVAVESAAELNPCPDDVGGGCPQPSNDGAIAWTIGGVAALGVGIPLIVIGAKQETEPARTAATLSPWANPDGAGLRLRLSL
jgi:hypothetical protein